MATRRLLEHRRNLSRCEQWIGRPDECGRPRDLRRRIRRAARKPIEPGRSARERGRREEYGARVVRECAEHRCTWCREREKRPMLRKRRTPAVKAGGSDREPEPGHALRADRLEQCCRVLRRIARQRVVAGRRDDEHAVPRRIGDCACLGGRARRTGHADVDDARAAAHRADDACGYIDVVDG